MTCSSSNQFIDEDGDTIMENSNEHFRQQRPRLHFTAPSPTLRINSPSSVMIDPSYTPYETPDFNTYTYETPDSNHSLPQPPYWGFGPATPIQLDYAREPMTFNGVHLSGQRRPHNRMQGWAGFQPGIYLTTPYVNDHLPQFGLTGPPEASTTPDFGNPQDWAQQQLVPTAESYYPPSRRNIDFSGRNFTPRPPVSQERHMPLPHPFASQDIQWQSDLARSPGTSRRRVLESIMDVERRVRARGLPIEHPMPAARLQEQVYDTENLRDSRVTAREEKPAKRMPPTCVACMEVCRPKNSARGPCGCFYCKECLNAFVRSGCEDVKSFPPRCHGQPLRLQIYARLLERDVIKRYKEVELERSSMTHIYCAFAKCSASIPSDRINDEEKLATCPDCDRCTCTKCRALLSDHKYKGLSAICPPPPQALKQVVDLAKREAWKQCPSCKNMLSKISGCDHMECSCGHQFCYRCGDCFDEHDLCSCSRGGRGDVARLRLLNEQRHGRTGRIDDAPAQFLADILNRDNTVRAQGEAGWPDHRRMLDPLGHTTCRHETYDQMPVPRGAQCHGCLLARRRQFICRRCSISLCGPCLTHVHTVDEGETAG